MKISFLALLLLVGTSLFAQKYKYYFIEYRATGKARVQVQPEDRAYYPDIDSLLVAKADTNKKGNRQVTGRIYENYAQVFDILSGQGLEFVQFVTLDKVGGGTAVIAGTTLPSQYAIWRRRIE